MCDSRGESLHLRRVKLPETPATPWPRYSDPMDEFTAVSKAREAYTLFAEAMETGREILLRAGIAEAPPPIPDFDTVFRRLSPELKGELFAELETLPTPAARVDALRIWQPLIKKAFGSNRRPLRH